MYVIIPNPKYNYIIEDLIEKFTHELMLKEDGKFYNLGFKKQENEKDIC